MDVGRACVETHFVVAGNAREAAVGHRRGDIHVADSLCFLQCFLAPASGDDVIGASVCRKEIDRDHRKLKTRAALKKEDAIVVGDAEQFAQTVFGARNDFVECFGAVTDLHHRHADARQGEQIPLCFFQNRNRQHRRPGTKIKNPFRHLPLHFSS